MRIELKVVFSVTGKTVCRFCNGRNAIKSPAEFVVVAGTGAPDKKKREPIVAPRPTPGTEPGFGKGFEPVNAVLPPLDARYAYWTAPLMSAGLPLANKVLAKVACGGVIFLKVTLPRPVMGIMTELVNPCATLLVKKPVSWR